MKELELENKNLKFELKRLSVELKEKKKELDDQIKKTPESIRNELDKMTKDRNRQLDQNRRLQLTQESYRKYAQQKIDEWKKKFDKKELNWIEKEKKVLELKIKIFFMCKL